MRQDAEFKAMLGALSPSELNALRESIEEDGVREPIVLWSQFRCKECGEIVEIHHGILEWANDSVWYCANCGHELDDDEYDNALESGVIVDGYNRASIASDFEIDVPVRFVVFNDRTEAKKWIARNQLGRRNIGPDKASYCRGLLYNESKQEHGTNQHTARSSQNEHSTGRTAEKLAQDHCVSPATIKRDGQFAESIDTLEDAIPGTMEDALSGKIPRAKIIEAAKQAKSGDFVAAKSTITKEESDKRIKKMREDMERSIEEKRKQDLERMPVYKRAASLLEGAGSLEYAIRALIKEIPEENRLAVITEAIKALRNESILMQRRQ